MTKYYTVYYNINEGEAATNTFVDSTYTILQTTTKEIPLFAADTTSSAGTLVFFNAFVSKISTDSIGNAGIQHNLYIYENETYVGSISYLHCWQNDSMKFTESNMLCNIVQASGKFSGSFGLPVYLELNNDTGYRKITFQYL